MHCLQSGKLADYKGCPVVDWEVAGSKSAGEDEFVCEVDEFAATSDVPGTGPLGEGGSLNLTCSLVAYKSTNCPE